MDETTAKFIVAGIILTTLEVPEDDEEICIFQLATQMSNDLWDHITTDMHESAPDFPAPNTKLEKQAN